MVAWQRQENSWEAAFLLVHFRTGVVHVMLRVIPTIIAVKILTGSSAAVWMWPTCLRAIAMVSFLEDSTFGYYILK
jgi:hypothetical protein